MAEFNCYFERTGHEECIYSIFPKETEEFIGYVGFHRQRNSDYEIEFYISKSQRRKGYCEEACKAVIELIFTKGLSVDNNVLSVQKLYATTLAENIAVINLLSKIGFQERYTLCYGGIYRQGNWRALRVLCVKICNRKK